MKITFVREMLLQGLNSVYQAVAAKPLLPILGNFYFEAKDGGDVVVSATNLEIFITQAVPYVSCDGKITTAIPASVFLELVKTMKDDLIVLDFQDTEVHIAGKQSQNKIKLISAKDFPYELPVEEYTLAFAAEEFKRAVQRVAFSAAASSSHAPILRGVLVENVGGVCQLVTIDGFRYSKHILTNKAEFSSEFSQVIPADQISVVAKAVADEEVKVGLSGNKVTFRSGKLMVACLILDGKFPDHKMFPTSSGIKISANTASLLSSCKQVKIFADPEKNRIYIKLMPMFMQLSSDEQAKGASSVDNLIEYAEGESGLQMILNAGYVAEALAIISSERVIMEFKNATSPAMFYVENEPNYVHAIQAIGK